MTILEVIQRSTEFLAKRGVESPRLQIELLLAHVLQMPRLRLYLAFERVLTEAELEPLRALVKRRANREPLQHLLGSTNFCGLEISVNPAVLIPRPETEWLAEHAGQFLSSLNTSPATALDFGTGSGCLALVLAQKCPTAHLHAVDISAEALLVARTNATRHGLESRVHFHHGDGFAALPDELRFDLIVANPPYIPSAEIASLEPEVRDHDPRAALDGGADGLDFYRRLASDAGARLQPEGHLMLEFGEDQAAAIRALLEANGWRDILVEKDLTQRERYALARRSNL